MRYDLRSVTGLRHSPVWSRACRRSKHARCPYRMTRRRAAGQLGQPARSRVETASSAFSALTVASHSGQDFSMGEESGLQGLMVTVAVLGIRSSNARSPDDSVALTQGASLTHGVAPVNNQ